MPAPMAEKSYTYADWCAWDDDKRWELIDGTAYSLASPSVRHQEISANLLIQLTDILAGKPCKAYLAVGVRLNADRADDTVFIPDVSVVSDGSKIGENTINGAPDLVIEILSPSTARYDMLTKFQQYEKYAVREYWVVDPASRTVQAHVLGDGIFGLTRIYNSSDKISINTLESREIDLLKVFA